MTLSALHIAARVAAAILGGYVFTWRFVHARAFTDPARGAVDPAWVEQSWAIAGLSVSAAISN